MIESAYLNISIIELPVIADVSDGAVKVAEKLPFELIATLVAAQVVRHHLLEAGWV